MFIEWLFNVYKLLNHDDHYIECNLTFHVLSCLISILDQCRASFAQAVRKSQCCDQSNAEGKSWGVCFIGQEVRIQNDLRLTVWSAAMIELSNKRITCTAFAKLLLAVIKLDNVVILMRFVHLVFRLVLQ